MSELDDIRKRWGDNYYSDMEIWDLADDLLCIATKLEADADQLRTERDEALQREAKNADKLKHYRMHFIPKLEAELAELRAERDKLQQEQRTMLIERARLVRSLEKASEVMGALEMMDGPDDDSRWRIWARRYIRSMIDGFKTACAALQEAEQ